ncbi:hypothetical protein [Streptomyces sp. NPDC002328]|uniref:hypothetical protein n=1 Tax=Streptomyces sp. NPDC002328 TaxID=3364642 RepID=UPI0036B6BCB1
MKVRADVAELLREGLSNAEVSRRTGVHPVKVSDARRALRLPDYRDMQPGYVAPLSRREHGTRAKYVVEKCRCPKCKRANRSEDNKRSRLQAYGRWQPYVDAEPVRQHVRALEAYGIGWKRVAKLAGVPASVVSKLLYGAAYRGRGPSKGLRPDNAAKLLAVQAVPENLATAVDGTGTRRRLQALIAGGWPQAQLARRLGMIPGNFGALLHANAAGVLPGTARSVAALYDELWRADPLEHGVHPQAASRARNQGRTNQWPPVGAWDDDTIDDPAATPDWTGQCGTPEGYWVHRRRGLLPACHRCRDANTAAKNARKAVAV